MKNCKFSFDILLIVAHNETDKRKLFAVCFFPLFVLCSSAAAAGAAAVVASATKKAKKKKKKNTFATRTTGKSFSNYTSALSCTFSYNFVFNWKMISRIAANEIATIFSKVFLIIQFSLNVKLFHRHLECIRASVKFQVLSVRGLFYFIREWVSLWNIWHSFPANPFHCIHVLFKAWFEWMKLNRKWCSFIHDVYLKLKLNFKAQNS